MPAQSPSGGTSILKLIPGLGADWRPFVSEVMIAASGWTFAVPMLFDDIDAFVKNPTIRQWNAALTGCCFIQGAEAPGAHDRRTEQPAR
jgi:hypothetical protein